MNTQSAKCKKVYPRPRGYRNYFDTTVLDGFPVTVWYNIEPRDNSVGIAGGVSEWAVYARDTNRYFGKWIYKRIMSTKGETDHIIEMCEQNYETL